MKTITYYHGTTLKNAKLIFQFGFELKRPRTGRFYGRGLYVTDDIRHSCRYGGAVIEAKIAKSSRILDSIEPSFRILSYLKREFGNEILAPAYWKSIPKRKKLQKQELIHLASYLVKKHVKQLTKNGNREPNFSRLYQDLRGFHYDGIKFLNPSESVIFNPSILTPVGVYVARNWSYDIEDDSAFEIDGPYPNIEALEKENQRK